MRQLYDREPRNESFQPRYRTNQPEASGSLNEASEERIVMLYTSGQSIESITRQVGRARHLVVHTLQSKGVFENRRTELHPEESKNEPLVIGEPKEELVNEELKRKPIAVEGSDPEYVLEEPPKKAKAVRESRSPEKLRSVTGAKTKSMQPAAEKPPVTGQWSPKVVDALCKVVGQHHLNPDMSLEEVQKMVSGSKRKAVRKG